jgi:hypothetical protein
MSSENDFFDDDRHDELFKRAFNRLDESLDKPLDTLPVKRLAFTALAVWAVGGLLSIGVGLGIFYVAARIVKAVFMS